MCSCSAKRNRLARNRGPWARSKACMASEVSRFSTSSVCIWNRGILSFSSGAIRCTGWPSRAAKTVRRTSWRAMIALRLRSSTSRCNGPLSCRAAGVL